MLHLRGEADSEGVARHDCRTRFNWKRITQIHWIRNMTRLTKRTVDALKPRSHHDTFIRDGELRGFGVRVKPSDTKTFIIQYLNIEGRTRRCVI